MNETQRLRRILWRVLNSQYLLVEDYKHFWVHYHGRKEEATREDVELYTEIDAYERIEDVTGQTETGQTATDTPTDAAEYPPRKQVEATLALLTEHAEAFSEAAGHDAARFWWKIVAEHAAAGLRWADLYEELGFVS